MRNRVLLTFVLCGLGGCPPTNNNGNVDDNLDGNINANDNSTDNSNDNPDAVDLDALGPDDPVPQLPAEKRLSQTPPTPAVPSSALLNEVRFLPSDTAPAFIELKIGADGAALDALLLRNEKGETLALPAGLPQPDPGALVVISFDGTDSAAAVEIHSSRTDFLNPATGSIALQNTSGDQLDTIAWGLDQPEAVSLNQGGESGDAIAGLVIARLPQSTTPNARFEWSAFGPVNATPGEPNFNSAVMVLIPHNGETAVAGEILLSWFPLDGVTQYRVQVATEKTFASPVFETTVDVAQALTPPLSSGTYHWRVQAVWPGGAESDFSDAHILFLVDSLDLSEQGELATGGQPKPRNRSQPATARTVHQIQGFPSFSQRKDSKMLLLESAKESGDHAWDQPHPTFDQDCKADNMNCSLASVAMINNFYGGDMTQDRIGFQKFRGRGPGPEGDLNWGDGTDSKENEAFALKIIPHIGRPATENELWHEVTVEIDANRPILLRIGGMNPRTNKPWAHAMVIVGYIRDPAVAGIPEKKSVIIFDPWNPGRASAKERIWSCTHLLQSMINYLRIMEQKVKPEKLEPGLMTTDVDDDKILDFDETERFKTRTEIGEGLDTDKDCIDDKIEIFGSVFNEQHGWGKHHDKSPSGDGKARNNNALPDRPELQKDFDRGGLPDFVEDLNLNGKFDPGQGETDPYDKKDDPRKITGTRFRNKDRDDPPDRRSIQTFKSEYELETGSDGKLTGKAKLTYTSRLEAHAEAAPPRCPQPRDIIWQYDPVKTEVEVEGEFVCGGPEGPSIYLRDKSDLVPIQATGTQTDPCLGGGPVFETALVHSGAAQFYSVAVDAFGVVSDAFFPTKDHAQWKAKFRYSTLDTEKRFTLEWDMVMTPK